ncbi:MAG TPA: PadR family transcriptional regulator [Candidatus Paceibacterota bacterium]
MLLNILMGIDSHKIVENNMRKGLLEFMILLAISKNESYSSDIIGSLKKADLIVVEGTLYPLLSRLRSSGLLSYIWKESDSGPPRKYYTLTDDGHNTLERMKKTWSSLEYSIKTLIKKI